MLYSEKLLRIFCNSKRSEAKKSGFNTGRLKYQKTQNNTDIVTVAYDIFMTEWAFS